MGDECLYCEGTGERDWLSGAHCFECNGTGMTPDTPDDCCPHCWNPYCCGECYDEEFEKLEER